MVFFYVSQYGGLRCHLLRSSLYLFSLSLSFDTLSSSISDAYVLASPYLSVCLTHFLKFLLSAPHRITLLYLTLLYIDYSRLLYTILHRTTLIYLTILYIDYSRLLYTILHRTTLLYTTHCTAPHCTTLHLITLHLTAPPNFTALNFTALHLTIPNYPASHHTPPHRIDKAEELRRKQRSELESRRLTTDLENKRANKKYQDLLSVRTSLPAFQMRYRIVYNAS